MKERKHRQKRIFLGEICVERLKSAIGILNEVGVREHCALRIAGGAGSVNNGSNVARKRHIRVIPRAAAGNSKLINADYFRISYALPLVYHAVNYNNPAERRKARRNVHHHSEMGGVGGDYHCLGIRKDVARLFIMKLGVNRHNGNACTGLSKIALDPRRRITENNCRIFFSWLDAEARSVPFGNIADASIMLTPVAAAPNFVFTPDESVSFRTLYNILFEKSSDSHDRNLLFVIEQIVYRLIHMSTPNSLSDKRSHRKPRKFERKR